MAYDEIDNLLKVTHVLGNEFKSTPKLIIHEILKDIKCDDDELKKQISNININYNRLMSDNMTLIKRMESNLLRMNTIRTIHNELMTTEEPETTLLLKYHKGVLIPPMETDKQIEEAFWKYYPDINIINFGSEKIARYLASIWLSDLPIMITLREKYEKVCPEGYHPIDNNNVKWSRENVKGFVELINKQELISIGW